MELIDRLLEKIEVVDDHWLWIGAHFWNGYGAIRVNGKFRPAHVVSYELFRGPLPEGMCALHTRDCVKHRDCIRPKHIYPGTRGDNSRDCFSTGGRGNSDLSDVDIVEIFLSADLYKNLAAKFNVSVGSISSIKSRRTFKHVTALLTPVFSPHSNNRGINSFGNFGGKRSKISPKDVIDIRNSDMTRSELALKYLITKEEITNILKRRVFKTI